MNVGDQVQVVITGLGEIRFYTGIFAGVSADGEGMILVTVEDPTTKAYYEKKRETAVG